MFKKLIFALVLLAATPALAQLSLADPNAPKEAPKVKATLIAEDDAVSPGKTVWVALRQEITPGWHTYWINPGDTGLATNVNWTLPEGYTAGALQFPTPHKQPTGDLVNYGYQDAVIIPVQITAPATAKSGETIELKAKANWLVCKDTCIPENAELSLKLKISAKPAPSAWASAFIAVKEKLPKANPAKQTAKIDGDNLVVTIDPIPLDASELPEEAYFFPHDGLLIQHNASQKMEMTGRSLTLIIPLNKTRTDPIGEISGDLWLRTMTDEKSFTFKATAPQTAPKPLAANQPTLLPKDPLNQPLILEEDHGAVPKIKSVNAIPGQDTQIGFLGAVFFALLGGILLNLMPCVFPVLSLKALGLVQKSHHEKHRSIVMGGIAYLAGVLATFTLLGLVIIALKNAGAQIGWGAMNKCHLIIISCA